ncbi:MAG: primosomal protein N' [Lactobacillales bacterium]|nr:primosomal protein N' [Lactobacillales bacterium]
MRVAQVIIDVKVAKLDNEYTYEIPSSLASLVQVGMRVEVPFNRRTLMGFVVDICEIDPAGIGYKILPITNVLDVAPVLNDELLAVADFIADNYYSYKISALQAMLPSVMKGAYSKVFVPNDLASPLERECYSGEELFKQGKADVEYVLNVKNKIKTEQRVKVLASGEIVTKKDYGLSAQRLKTQVKHGVIELVEVEVKRDVLGISGLEKSRKLELNDEQQAAFDAVTTDDVYLLEGITGSGKTEVFLHLIEKTLNEGRNVILLVPEISLTPQMLNRVTSRFGSLVATLHSALNPNERYDEWRRIKEGDARVVVGARSAVFAPLENIGLIIIDEEHEGSYAQDNAPSYHAREVAKFRAEHHRAPVILASATPSLESRARAQKGVYKHLTLTKRANPNAILPKVEIIDMAEELRTGNFSIFSSQLKEEIATTLESKNQAVLMINRRGYANFIMCRSCSYVPECPNCAVSLTYHASDNAMHCHYCGHREQRPQTCPSCGGNKISEFGVGTQKAVTELQKQFPDARILRIDADTTSRKGSLKKMLDEFGAGKHDIIVGTQIVAKGLDFPNVTLVGVVNADTTLNLPDYRASEKTFELLTQVAGRAGRADKLGTVVIQTYNPKHYAVDLVRNHDYNEFYQKEMRYRKMGKYSPFYYGIRIEIVDKNEDKALKKAYEITNRLKRQLAQSAIILGPVEAPVKKINNKFYYHINVKYRDEALIKAAIREIKDEIEDINIEKLA